jgi:hypothetical protein
VETAGRVGNAAGSNAISKMSKNWNLLFLALIRIRNAPGAAGCSVKRTL